MIPSPIFGSVRGVLSVAFCDRVIDNDTRLDFEVFLKVDRNYGFISTKKTAFTEKHKGGQGDLRSHGRLGVGLTDHKWCDFHPAAGRDLPQS
jgi:hypothetical protein